MRSPRRTSADPLVLLFALSWAAAWLGLIWDGVWHVDIGRDSALIPPHVLTDLGIGGAIVIAAVRSAPLLARDGFRRWLSSSSSPGFTLAVLVGVGGLLAVGIDLGWHELVGKDVTAWSPPHIVIDLTLIGLAVALAVEVAAQRARPAVVDVLVGIALGSAGVLVFEFDTGVPNFGRVWWPMVVAAEVAIFAAPRALVSRGGATRVVASAVAMRVVTYLFLLAVGRTAMLPPLPLLLVAVAIDLTALRRSAWWIAGASAAAWVVAFAVYGSLDWLTRVAWPSGLDALALSTIVVAGSALLASRAFLSDRPGRPSARYAYAALAAVAVVVTALPQVVGDPGDTRTVEVTRDATSLTVRGSLPSAAAANVFEPESADCTTLDECRDAGTAMRWVGKLERHGDELRIDVSGSTFVALWLVDGRLGWRGDVQPESAGPLELRRTLEPTTRAPIGLAVLSLLLAALVAVGVVLSMVAWERVGLRRPLGGSPEPDRLDAGAPVS